ncbi:MAG: DUF6527 family protein [Thiovulaceae bacterium]|nr:DUF6527 family protein [Sulfurimonadaceae bacterium]
MPKEYEQNVLYVSMEYKTVTHLCCCGCGKKVVTPIAPHSWKITYDGNGITLYPSIGNWDFNCRSHYWIRDSQVLWANDWDESKVQATKIQHNDAKLKYSDKILHKQEDKITSKKGIFQKILSYFK